MVSFPSAVSLCFHSLCR